MRRPTRDPSDPMVRCACADSSDLATTLSTDPPELVVVVGPDAVGQRIDAVLGRVPEIGSRAEAQRLISDGRVQVNGQPPRKRDALVAGATIRVQPRAAPSSELVPDASVAFGLAYQDEYLIVVDKPAGLVVHPARGHATGTLVHGLLAMAAAGGDDPTRPGIVHRLDRDTSGLMVVARSEQVHRRLQRMLRERRVERRYLVLVHGTPPPAFSVDRPIARHRRDRLRMAVVSEGTGREAVTHVRVLEQWAGVALCEARLETGRTHQIRVHLESAGFPVVGDPVYGRRADRRGLDRQFLHAYRLAFDHPIAGRARIDLESPLPHDLDLSRSRERSRAAK
jgi:23S rRNA pseudouridine1911/1915/1917 synthase